MRSALYYPHTTVGSKNLVKTGLLLWDKLEFLVPYPEFSPTYGNKKIAQAMELIGRGRCPTELEKNVTHENIEKLLRQPLPLEFFYDETFRSERYDVYPENFSIKLGIFYNALI